MTPERLPLPRQTKFVQMPTFLEKDLAEAIPAKMRFFDELVPGEFIGGTGTNVTEMETIYPYLLDKLGVIKAQTMEETGMDLSEASQKGALIGQKLHMADVLFSLVLQDARTPEKIQQILPTTKKDMVHRYWEAMANVRQGEIESRDDLETRIHLAWTNFHMVQRNFFKDRLAPPLPGFGIPDPQVKEEIFASDEVMELGFMLADAWIEEILKEDGSMTWEFQRNVLTQREVLISVKFTDANLQFKAVLDSVTRRPPEKKVVKVQSVDLKTGRRPESGGWKRQLEDEIRIRQNQVSQVISEIFTSKYLKGYESLETGNGIFPSRGNVSKTSRRIDKAGYRWLDKETGKMDFEELKMEDDEREEFGKWLVWYGNMVNDNKQEVKKILKRRLQYDLKVPIKSS